MLQKSLSLRFALDVVPVTKLVIILYNGTQIIEGVEVLKRAESNGVAADVVA